MKQIGATIILINTILSLNISALWANECIRDIPPSEVTAFLDIHFKDMELVELKYDSRDGECKAIYKNGYEIEFKGDTWVKIESDYHPLPKSIIDILPATIMKYIANNYPRKSIIKIKKKLSGYKVELTDTPDLFFDRQGNFIKKD